MNVNVIVGKPIVDEKGIFYDEKVDLYTKDRFLPSILVELGIFKSNSEVRKNRHDLFRELNDLDFEHIKIGKKDIWLLVGN